MHEQPSPDFEKEIRESFNSQAANPAFLHGLRATLLERSKMKDQARSFPRLAWRSALMAVLVLAVGLLVASPGMAASLKRLLGYLPGMGYVNQEDPTLRVLSKPVIVEKDGLKVTIEKGAANLQRTVLFGRVEGYPLLDGYPAPTCDAYPRLILPDGTTLQGGQQGTSREDGQGSIYYVSDTFEGLPAGQLDATLEIPCVMFDSNYTDFTFQLHFQIPDKTQILPGIELATPAPAGSAPQPGPTTAAAPSAESTVEGFSIVLESGAPLADGYILAGHYEWTDTRFNGFSVQANDPRITDATGKELEIAPVDTVLSVVDPAIRKEPFAYKIVGKDYTAPLTLTVRSLVVNDLPGQGTFRFDAGADPRAGQEWDVSIDVPVAGHIIHVQSIQVIAGGTPSSLGFEFTMTSDSEVLCVTVSDAKPVITGNGAGGGGGGGGGGGMDCGSGLAPLSNSWVMEGYSPAGVKTFVVSGVSVAVPGTWIAIWQPAAPQ